MFLMDSESFEVREALNHFIVKFGFAFYVAHITCALIGD